MSPAKKAPKKHGSDDASGSGNAQRSHEASAPGIAVAAISGKPLATRGRTFVGKVISDRMAKTVTVEWERRRYVPKYQRYEKRRTRVKAHDEIGARTGDLVEIRETRPLSKTKNFLVIRKIEK